MDNLNQNTNPAQNTASSTPLSQTPPPTSNTPPPIQPQQPAQPQMNNQGMSYQTKTIIVVLLLLFAYPLGVIFMFLWMKWPKWVKILITLGLFIIALPIIGIIAAVILVAVNPNKALMQARDTQRASDIATINISLKRYQVDNDRYPNTLEDLVPEYLKQIPQDPVNKTNYNYRVEFDGEDYQLCVDFESKTKEDLSKCYNSKESI